MTDLSISSAQDNTAIFMVSQHIGKFCENEKELINDRQTYCLEKVPLIFLESFAAVSNIYYATGENTRRMDIILDENGSKRLNSLARAVAGAEIAVVVNHRLVSVIKVIPPFNSKLITLWDEEDSNVFEEIHKHLQSIIPNPR